MEQSFIDLVVQRVKERFTFESEFYEKQLGLDQLSWEELKSGRYIVSEKEAAVMIRLFTDYEWMLIQKILRQSHILPEKERTAVDEFTKMKFTIAKKWMQNESARVELVEKLQEEQRVNKTIEVRVVMDYEAWGFEDILSFTFPAIERDKVSASKRELIQYMTELEKEHYEE